MSLQQQMPELRSIEKELKELEKAVDTRYIDEKNLRVLNMLPISHEMKVQLFEEMLLDAQREQLKEVNIIKK